MIQRLLRGQALYVILGALVVFLYARTRPFRLEPTEMAQPSLSAPASSSAAADRAAAESWWPTSVELAKLHEQALHHPHLGLALSVLTVILVGMFLGGLALTLWALATGRLRGVLRFRGRRPRHWSLNEVWRIALLTLMVASLLPFLRLAFFPMALAEFDAHLWLTVSMLFLDGLVILTILSFAVGKRRSMWRLFGVSRLRLWPAISVGVRSYIGVFPWLFALLIGTVELVRRFGLQPPIEPIQELVFNEDRPSVLALTVALACVVGPVTEELFFRGVLYAAIRQRTSRLVSMLASGAIFSLIHTNPVGFLPIMLLGCLLAYVYERTGSLIGPLAVHMFHNTLLMSLALVFRRLVGL